MKILLDNGHGFDTPGKHRPDGHFREYAYNRYLAFRIRERLQQLGLVRYFSSPFTSMLQAMANNGWTPEAGAASHPSGKLARIA